MLVLHVAQTFHFHQDAVDKMKALIAEKGMGHGSDGLAVGSRNPSTSSVTTLRRACFGRSHRIALLQAIPFLLTLLLVFATADPVAAESCCSTAYEFRDAEFTVCTQNSVVNARYRISVNQAAGLTRKTAPLNGWKVYTNSTTGITEARCDCKTAGCVCLPSCVRYSYSPPAGSSRYVKVLGYDGLSPFTVALNACYPSANNSSETCFGSFVSGLLSEEASVGCGPTSGPIASSNSVVKVTPVCRVVRERVVDLSVVTSLPCPDWPSYEALATAAGADTRLVSDFVQYALSQASCDRGLVAADGSSFSPTTCRALVDSLLPVFNPIGNCSPDPNLPPRSWCVVSARVCTAVLSAGEAAFVLAAGTALAAEIAALETALLHSSPLGVDVGKALAALETILEQRLETLVADACNDVLRLCDPQGLCVSDTSGVCYKCFTDFRGIPKSMPCINCLSGECLGFAESTYVLRQCKCADKGPCKGFGSCVLSGCPAHYDAPHPRC